jgi:DNA-binding MarR family transcriptional regulator
MDSLLIGKKLAVFHRSFHAIVSKRLKKIDINKYFIILLLLDTSDKELTQQNICETLYIDKVTMVKMIDYLSSFNYLKRLRNPKDRREKIILLTPKAKKALPQIKEAYSHIIDVIFMGIDKEEINDFVKKLNIMDKNLQNYYFKKHP